MEACCVGENKRERREGGGVVVNHGHGREDVGADDIKEGEDENNVKGEPEYEKEYSATRYLGDNIGSEVGNAFIFACSPSEEEIAAIEEEEGEYVWHRPREACHILGVSRVSKYVPPAEGVEEFE